jgi:hypothetical protein
MNEVFKDLKYISLATKSLKVLSILRAVLTVGIIVFSVLKGRVLTKRIIK